MKAIFFGTVLTVVISAVAATTLGMLSLPADEATSSEAVRLPESE